MIERNASLRLMSDIAVGLAINHFIFQGKVRQEDTRSNLASN